MRFLSDEWFASAARLLEGVRAPSGATLRIQFDASGTAWSLVATEGERPELTAGPIDAPDAELRWSREDALQVWRRELRGEAALTKAEVRTPSYTGAPAPFDMLDMPEIAALPRLPGVDLTAQYVFTQGPFGTVAHALVFEDGKFVRDVEGEVEGYDVRVIVPFAAIGPVRQKEWSILDALARGTIEGELGPMAMLAGILESPEFQAAENATDRHSYALGALGALDADPAFTAAMEQLAAETDAE
jgi:hypothetical protein